MMNKKYLFILSLIISLAACSNNGASVEPEPYVPNFGSEREHHKVDEGFKLDGILDEEAYSSVKHFKGIKTSGDEWASVDWSMYFGNEGVYIGVDVNENTEIYVNPFRSTFINSGIEMYLFPTTATSYGTPYTLEIDMVADGTLFIKRNIGGSSYGACEIENANTPYLATFRKEKKDGINGYTHELFMPYEFFQRLEFVGENEKINALNGDIVHIASKNYEGNNSNIDRNYYSFANKQLDSGVAWTKPQFTYRFAKDVGFICYDINVTIEGKGEVSEVRGYDFAVPNNSCTLIVKPSSGRIASIVSATVNGENVISSIGKTSETGVYQLIVPKTLVVDNLDIYFKFN